VLCEWNANGNEERKILKGKKMRLPGIMWSTIGFMLYGVRTYTNKGTLPSTRGVGSERRIKNSRWLKK